MGLLNTVTQLQQQPQQTQAPASGSGGMPGVIKDYFTSQGVNGPGDLTWHSGALSDDLSDEDRNDMWGGSKIVPGNNTGTVQNIGQGWSTPDGNVIQAGTNWTDPNDRYRHFIMNQSQDGSNNPSFGSYYDPKDLSWGDAASMVAMTIGGAFGMAGLSAGLSGLGAGAEGLAGMEGLSGMDVAADGGLWGNNALSGFGFGGEIGAQPWTDINGADLNSDIMTQTGHAPGGSVNLGVNTPTTGGFSVSPQQVIKQVVNQSQGGGGQPQVVTTGGAPVTTNTGGGQSPQTTGTNTGGGMPITTGTGSGGATGGSPQSTDLASTLLGIGGGLYDMNQQDRAANNMLTYLQGRQQMNDNMYNPGTPEYNALWDQMSRKDAAAGRNSQYGPRSVDLAARVAQLKMDANTKMTTGIGNFMANAYNQRAGSASGLMGALQNGGLANLTRLLGGGGSGGVNVPGGGSGGGGNLSPGNTGGNGTGNVGTGGDNNGPNDTEGNGVNYGNQGYDGDNGVDYGGAEGYGGENGVDYGDWGPESDWSDWDNFDWGGGGWDSFDFGTGADFGFDDFGGYF
jgi:hypothetical protein